MDEHEMAVTGPFEVEFKEPEARGVMLIEGFKRVGVGEAVEGATGVRDEAARNPNRGRGGSRVIPEQVKECTEAGSDARTELAGGKSADSEQKHCERGDETPIEAPGKRPFPA